MPDFIMKISLALIFFAISSCNNDPILPEGNQPGRRDYEWIIDTLFVKQGYIINAVSEIWGSTSNDVWMIASADPGYKLWHYDGFKWLRDSILTQIAPEAIYGFSKNNIWMSNRSNGANFWHYDGTHWRFYSEHLINGFNEIIINKIFGESINDVYAVGFADRYIDGNTYKGVLFHFNGNQWTEINIGQVRVSFEDILEVKNVLYIRGTVYEQGFPDTSKIYIFNNSSLKEIYSNVAPSTISKIGTEIYIGIDKKIYKINSNMQLQLWRDFSNTEFLFCLQGRSENDLFCFGNHGLMHYNGSDLVTILPLEDISVTQVTIFKNDIILGGDNFVSGEHFIIRGSLQD